MVNVPLFHRIMKHVFLNPQGWNQDYWGDLEPACGTTFCIAGHAANFAAQERPHVSLEWDGEALSFVRVAERRWTVGQFAENELGLSTQQGWVLFRTLDHDEAWRRVAELTNGEVTREKIAAEVEAERARHREDDPDRRKDDETESEETEPHLQVVMHDVAVAAERVSA